jgi:hypothetical protein
MPDMPDVHPFDEPGDIMKFVFGIAEHGVGQRLGPVDLLIAEAADERD